MKKMKRNAKIQRKTSETDISVEITLNCLDKSKINSGVSFFDHMLESMTRHGRFFMHLECAGDTHIDDHHSVEDVGICMGQALKKALGDKKGITRFGDAIIPMDESLALAAVDLSGRACFKYQGSELKGYINQYSEELTAEFLRSFAVNAEMNLHINLLNGENRHHIHEAIFKAFGIALYKATCLDDSLGKSILSTKGTI